MNRKFRGFTIAELLISLLIISIVLAAAIPTITKRKSGKEEIWHWAATQNSTYFGLTNDQSVIIGNTYKPEGASLTNSDSNSTYGTASSLANFSNSGDKLVLVKQTKGVKDSAHISFYNIETQTSGTATTSDVKYMGRLVLDQTNMALGIGSLANQNDTDSSSTPPKPIGNTALGHYTLVLNSDGSFNTAVGQKALSKNQSDYNTMVGYYAGANTSGTAQATDFNNGQMNTGIGSFALINNANGDNNTAVGYMALSGAIGAGNTIGRANTAIGAGACSFANRDGNICIGNNAGNTIMSNVETSFKTLYSLNFANDSNPENNMLFLGTGDTPLITGRLMHISSTQPKFLAINTSLFDINSTDAETNVLRVNAGADGKSILSFKPYTSSSSFRDFDIRGIYDGDGNSTGLKLSIDNDQFQVVTGLIDGTVAYPSINSSSNVLGVNDRTLQIVKSSDSAILRPKGGNYLAIDYNPASGTFENYHAITLNPSGGINIQNKYGAGQTNGAYIALTPGGDINIQSPTLSINSFNAYINSKTKFANNIDFEASSFVSFKSDPNIAGLKDIGSTDLAAQAGNDGIKSNMIRIWTALYSIRSTMYSYHSDARLKNISGDSKAGLKEINKLEVKNYTYKADKEKKPHVGVIAQQLQKVFPNSVFKGEDGYLRINTEEIFYAMVNSIKELYAQLQTLTAKITGLDNRIKKLEAENAQLKKQNAEFEKRLQKLEAKSK